MVLFVHLFRSGFFICTHLFAGAFKNFHLTDKPQINSSLVSVKWKILNYKSIGFLAFVVRDKDIMRFLISLMED